MICPLFSVGVMLTLQSHICVTVPVIKDLPASPPTLFYSVSTVSVSRNSLGLIESLLMVVMVALHRNRVRCQNGLKIDLCYCEALPQTDHRVHFVQFKPKPT